MAFAARGNGDSQWWRHGHSHLDESEIWLRKEGSPATYEKLVDLNGRNAWPMWMPDGRTLYFMSDRSGAQNIWSLTLGGKMRQVTKFTDGRVLWPSIGYDGKAVVFERDFKIWQLDTKSGEAYPAADHTGGLGGTPGDLAPHPEPVQRSGGVGRTAARWRWSRTARCSRRLLATAATRSA